MKSLHKQSKPKIQPETVDLIRTMVKENHLWGAEQIRGELLKIGIKACKRTTQKYLPKVRESPPSSQTWATIVKNHVRGIWACDFTEVYDWLFRPWHIFVQIPNFYNQPNERLKGRIVSRAILGGLHHSFSRTACPK